MSVVLMVSLPIFLLCFCKQKTAYEMRISDWSSDVCSSDLCAARIAEDHLDAQVLQRPDQYLRSAHFTGRHHKLLFRRSAERRRRYLLKYSASTLLCVTLLQTVAGPSGLYSENAAPLSGAA